MTRYRRTHSPLAFIAFLFLSFCLFAVLAHGQNTLSISNPSTPPAGGYAPGQVVPLNITKAGGVTATTGIQLDFATSAGTLAYAPGPAMPASKQLSCVATGCLIIGFNTDPIPDGVLIIVTETLPAAIASSPVTVTVKNPIESDAAGNSLPVVIGNPTVSMSLRNGCDVNGDGSVSSADLSAVVSQALAKTTSAATDLDRDGKTTVTDAQIVGTAGTPPVFICNAK